MKSTTTNCFGTPVEVIRQDCSAHLKQAKCALLLLALVSLDDKVVLESTIGQLPVCRYPAFPPSTLFHPRAEGSPVYRNTCILPFRLIFPCRNHMGHCPGETGSLLWLSFSLWSRPETGFVAICIVLQTKNCDVLHHIMHKVTFTSPLTFHIFVEMYVHCTFGHFDI